MSPFKANYRFNPIIKTHTVLAKHMPIAKRHADTLIVL